MAADKCLGCHKPLQARVTAGKGLHARPEYRDCKTCHVEHQGVEYELVWWGKAGKKAFDHAQTGHPLAGKHQALSCEQCHKARSYLGNVTDCASCHKDEHRGQFAARACSSCHTEQAWKPAPGFDHARTSWPLTGRHAPVSCEKCHTTRRPDPANAAVSYRVFRAVAGKDCASCHEDTHKGRLGTSCSSCHSTAGWRGLRRHRRLQPLEDGLPADRAPRRRELREVPRPRPSDAPEARPLHRLPRRRARRPAREAGRRRALRELPRRQRLPPRPLRSRGPREDRLPARRRAPGGGLRPVPQAGRLRHEPGLGRRSTSRPPAAPTATRTRTGARWPASSPRAAARAATAWTPGVRWPSTTA